MKVIIKLKCAKMQQCNFLVTKLTFLALLISCCISAVIQVSPIVDLIPTDINPMPDCMLLY